MKNFGGGKFPVKAIVFCYNSVTKFRPYKWAAEKAKGISCLWKCEFRTGYKLGFSGGYSVTECHHLVKMWIC